MTENREALPRQNESEVTISREVADEIDRALTKTITTAVAFYSDEPYLDDPRWTPWTRFGKPLADRANQARTKLREAADDV